MVLPVFPFVPTLLENSGVLCILLGVELKDSPDKKVAGKWCAERLKQAETHTKREREKERCYPARQSMKVIKIV